MFIYLLYQLRTKRQANTENCRFLFVGFFIVVTQVIFLDFYVLICIILTYPYDFVKVSIDVKIFSTGLNQTLSKEQVFHLVGESQERPRVLIWFINCLGFQHGLRLNKLG